VLGFVEAHARKLNDAIAHERTNQVDYFGLRTLYDRYLLKHPTRRHVIETPQHFWMRIAVAVSPTVPEAFDLYSLFSNLDYIASSPTLFNAGTRHEQLSSCFLLDSPEDSLESIYDKYKEIALLSKFSGGIGVAWHRVRAEGALIRGTNGLSNGIVPWLKTLDSSVGAVNQGGKRKGAACVYLEPWHADVEAFLELRDNTGDEGRRTSPESRQLDSGPVHAARRRPTSRGRCSIRKTCRSCRTCSAPRSMRPMSGRGAGPRPRRTIKARDLYVRMMRVLAQTGNGWMTFKDKANRACNQTAKPGHTVHLSNLCTEILEVTSAARPRSAISARSTSRVTWARTASTSRSSHIRWNRGKAARPRDRYQLLPDRSAPRLEYALASGRLGCHGLQDVFFQLRLAFDSDAARALSTRIAEEIYFHALRTSMELARQHGRARCLRRHPRGARRAAVRRLGRDTDATRPLERSARGNQVAWLRNSLLIAIAPTATIASIAGCYECIEPQVSNLFKRETLSGDFLQVNRYLVEELKQLGLWTEEMRNAIKLADGSVQGLDELPEELRSIYRTAWEVPMRALIDLAAERGAFIDQSQSLNLFMANPNIGQLSSMYMYAWKRGLKTTYYLRSRPATQIAKTTVQRQRFRRGSTVIACSLENPESCEACQ
jgi:ribonucleoside-diphosphate reductase alpha chain